jgi:hypothetical protein
MENDGMDLEIIVNHKQSDKGEPVIQLETAVGAAIKRASCLLPFPLTIPLFPLLRRSLPPDA